MNNFKFDYGKKYHYLLKYIIMSIPVLLLMLSFLFPTKQITNNYSVESETIINYKYETNEVNNVNDLVVGNAYCFKNQDFMNDHEGLNFNDAFDPSPRYRLIGLDGTAYFDLFTLDDSYLEDIIFNNFYFNIYNEYLEIFLDDDYNSYFDFADFGIYFDDVINIYFVIIDNVSFQNYAFDYIVPCPDSKNIIESTTISNTINDNSSVISVDEVRSNNTDYLKPLNDFYKLSFNNWYDNLLSAMNLTIDNDTTYYLYHIPLYIIFVYIFDIIVDLFGLIFRLGHKLISKVGGDY